MLGRPAVEPEHLLLALTRHGNVRRLFERRGVSGTDVFDAIVRAQGIGDELMLGRVPRSTATDAALGRAVDIAAHRDVLGRSSDLLLALAAEKVADWRGSWPRPVSTTSTSWSTASPGTDARRSATRTSSRTCCGSRAAGALPSPHRSRQYSSATPPAWRRAPCRGSPRRILCWRTPGVTCIRDSAGILPPALPVALCAESAHDADGG